MFVLVHGAWHGGWMWERVTPLLAEAGARFVAPDLTSDRDVGLRDHVDELLSVVDCLAGSDLVLVGHSYAGLVVRQVADLRPERVAHVVLVEGWAGPDGASIASLAPDWFMARVLAAVEDGWRVPPPAPAMFGITDPDDTRWLARRLLGHPLRTFTEPTSLSGAVDRIPGTGVYCRPQVFPFDELAAKLGYGLVALDGPHDVPLSDPRAVAEVLLRCRNEKREA